MASTRPLTVEACAEGLFGPLEMRYVGRGRYRLVVPFEYRRPGDPVTVPMGFETDLDSVPRIPLVYMLLHGRAIRSAVIHDWLYWSQQGRDYADIVFLRAMQDEGIGQPLRWLIYQGVRLFGEPIYRRKGEVTP